MNQIGIILKPTYWPSDLKKIPNIIDFCETKGIANHSVIAESCLDLFSDPSPILLTLSNQFESAASATFLHNTKIDWIQFGDLVENGINLNIPLCKLDDIESAKEHFNFIVQNAAWNSSPNININSNKKISNETKLKIQEMRNVRKLW